MTKSKSAHAEAPESSRTKAPATAIPVLRLVLVLGAIAVVGATSACASSAHGMAVSADRELSRRANEALVAAGTAGAEGETNRIEATGYRGVVSLLGESSDTAAQEAERVVRAVPGVVRVNNLLISNEGPSATSGSARSEKAPIAALATGAVPGGR